MLELLVPVVEARAPFESFSSSCAAQREDAYQLSSGIDLSRSTPEQIVLFEREIQEKLLDELLVYQKAHGGGYPMHLSEELREQIQFIRVISHDLGTVSQWYTRQVLPEEDEVVSQLQGMGPAGVTRAQDEVRQMICRVKSRLISYPLVLREMVEKVRFAPVPAVASLIKVLGVLFVYLILRLKIIPLLKRYGDRAGCFHAVGFMRWMFLAVYRPLIALLALNFIHASITSYFPLEELDFLRRALSALFLYALFLRLLNALAAHRLACMGVEEEIVVFKIRQRTLRLLTSTVVFFAWIKREIAITGPGPGTLYFWTERIFAWVFLLVLLLCVHWWRHVVREKLTGLPEKHPMHRMYCRLGHGLLVYPGLIVGGVYLCFKGVLEWFERICSTVPMLRPIATYVLRMEVSRHAGSPEAILLMEDPRLNCFSRTACDAVNVQSYAAEELQDAAKILRGGPGTYSVVVGVPGTGKTRFFKKLATTVEDEVCCNVLACPYGGFDELLKVLNVQFGLSETSGEDELIAEIEAVDQELSLCFDGFQRLIYPRIGGLQEMERFNRFFRRIKHAASVFISVDLTVWQFLVLASAEKQLFDHILFLPKWKVGELRELVHACMKQGDLSVSFDRLDIPSQFEQPEDAGKDRNELTYFRLLNDYAKGNPTVALYFWMCSLTDGEQTLEATLFRTPSLSVVEELPRFVLFVLRTTLLLEEASEDELTDCTGLTAPVVEDALRILCAKGIYEKTDNRFRISWYWYPSVLSVLERKHFVVGDSK